MKLFLTPLIFWAIFSQAVSRYLLVEMDDGQGNHALNNNKIDDLYFSITNMLISLIFNNTPIIIDICTLPKQTGPCKARIRMFYFDHMLGQCKEFIYGGCGGNANKFETINKCETKCKGIRRIFFIIDSC